MAGKEPPKPAPRVSRSRKGSVPDPDDPTEIDEEYVKTLTDYMQCMRLLKNLKLETKGVQNVEEAKELLFEYLWKPIDIPISTMAERVLVEDKDARRFLAEICEDVEKYVGKLPKQQKNYITRVSPNFAKELKAHVEKLRQETSTILISGETGSGKSTILNLLLGVNLFPVSLLPSTSTICEIKWTDDKPRFVAHCKSGNETETRYFTGNEEEDCRMLAEYIHKRGDRVYLPYKKVEVFLKADWLKSGVTLVDSPGVGESDDLTGEVLNYMSNATGFLYIINSGTGGGIQEDRLKVLVKQITQDTSQRKDVMACQSTMFVCNKWDQVPVNETDVVWDYTMRELGKIWPDLSPEQVFRMDTKLAQKLQKKDVTTKDYRDLLEGVETLMMRCLRPHKLTVAHFLRPVLMSATSSLQAAIADCARGRTEQDKCIRTLREQLRTLSYKRDEIMRSMAIEFTNQKMMAVDSIVQHFRNENIRTRLLDYWTNATCPADHGDAEGLRKRQEHFVNKKFREECEKWEASHQVIKTTQTKMVEIFQSHFRSINHHLNNIHKALTEDCKAKAVIESGIDPKQIKGNNKPRRFNKAQIAGLVLAAPLLLPIGLVAGVVRGVQAAKQAIDAKQALKDYKANKVTIMRQLAQEMLPVFRQPGNIEMIVEEQLKDVKVGIFSLFDTTIPNIIKADEELLDDLIKMRSDTEASLQRDLKPWFQDGLELLNRLDMYQISYAKPQMIEASCLEWDEKTGPLGESYCGQFYNGQLCLRGKRQDVVVRLLPNVASIADSASALIEEDNLLRKLDHPNVVPLRGTVTKQVDEKVAFGFVFDGKLKRTLRQAIKSDDFSPAKNPNSSTAMKTVQEILKGICGALFHLHQLDNVHGNVNPDGILLFDNRPKLGELGFLDNVHFQGADNFFLAYTAPELMASDNYLPASDVYCLGIVAWEMWYGESVVEHMASRHGIHLKEAIERGKRPVFNSPQPPARFKKLIECCWDANPEARPSLQELVTRLDDI